MSISNKKNIYYIVSLVLTLLVFAAASTFAYFSVIASREKDSTKIYTGTVMINYHQGDIIKGEKIVPGTDFGNGAKEPNINTEVNVYKNNFSVSNTGTLPVKLDVNIGINTNEFSHNILKYILFDSNGGKLATGSLPKTGNVQVIKNLYLKNNNTGNYTLMIWLYDDGTNQNEEQGKTFNGKIVVNARQPMDKNS